MKSTDKFVLVLVASLFLLLAGCGGGGGSSDPEPMAMTCPTGQTGTPPNCMDPEPSEPMQTQAEIDGLTKAIADPDGDGTPTGGLNKGARPGGATAMIAAGPGGEITYGGNDVLGKDDKLASGESREGQFGMPSDAATITGLTGTTQSKTADNVMTELVVYSDAEPVKSEKYLTYFADTNTSGANMRPAEIAGVDVDSTNAIKDGTLTFTADAAVTSAGAYGGSLFEFTSGGVSTKTHPSDDATTDTDEHKIAGSIAGVPGTFVCGAASGGCPVSGNAKGELTSFGAGWSFVPDGTASNINVADVKKDLNYLSFGYWLTTTTKTDGSMTYGVNTFATGAQAFDVGVVAIADLTGTATYTGDATGLYVMKDFSTGAGVPSEAGQFTADAKLTANFGGDGVAIDNQFHISGMISNFRDAMGAMISGGAWTVNLGKNADNFTTTTVGGSTDGGGDWTGTFYGQGKAADDASTTSLDERAPTGIAGEFNAHFGNGHVVGAFGATR